MRPSHALEACGGNGRDVLLRLLTLHRQEPFLEFLEAVKRAGAIRTLESLARIEAGAQGGALIERTTTTRTAKDAGGGRWAVGRWVLDRWCVNHRFQQGLDPLLRDPQPPRSPRSSASSALAMIRARVRPDCSEGQRNRRAGSSP